MRFKCEIELKPGKIVLKVFLADNLQELSEQIIDEFPNGKVLSIIGGE